MFSLTLYVLSTTNIAGLISFSSRSNQLLRIKIEMNGVLGHLCAAVGKNGPRKPPVQSR